MIRHRSDGTQPNGTYKNSAQITKEVNVKWLCKPATTMTIMIRMDTILTAIEWIDVQPAAVEVEACLGG